MDRMDRRRRFSGRERRRRPLGGAALAAAFLLAAVRGGEAAQEPTGLERLEERVRALEREIATLRESYEARLAALEARVAALAAEGAAPGAEPAAAEAASSEEERAALEAELAAILGETPSTPGAGASPPAQSETGRRFVGRTRTLTELNPEISVTGDVFGVAADRTGDPESNQFRFAEFEVAFQAPLDPFSLAKAFVVQEEGEFEVEEAYIDWTALPGGLGLKVGAYRNDWGKLNRWHQHALPQADRPLVHQAFFGEEGLKGLGASVSWLTPPFLGDYNELWLQVMNDENDVAFSGRGFDDPIFVLHETNYWDLGGAAYLELGLSAATGVNDPAGRFRTTAYGIDWSFDWRPPERALYRGLELRGELLRLDRDGEDGTETSWGAYTYATYKLNRQWYVGVRADWTEIPGEPGEDLWGVSPYAEWWQSEWARIRFQYSHASRRLEEEERDNRLFFQVTWALGPHKHEKY